MRYKQGEVYMDKEHRLRMVDGVLGNYVQWHDVDYGSKCVSYVGIFHEQVTL